MEVALLAAVTDASAPAAASRLPEVPATLRWRGGASAGAAAGRPGRGRRL